MVPLICSRAGCTTGQPHSLSERVSVSRVTVGGTCIIYELLTHLTDFIEPPPRDCSSLVPVFLSHYVSYVVLFSSAVKGRNSDPNVCLFFLDSIDCDKRFLVLPLLPLLVTAYHTNRGQTVRRTPDVPDANMSLEVSPGVQGVSPDPFPPL